MRSLSRLLAATVLVIGGVVTSSCGSASRRPDATTVTVFAASSLTEAFTEIGTSFEQANPDVTVRFSFGGSGELATQIDQGAPADVFASADVSNMARLVAAGHASGTPVVVARNSMEIIVEAGNPKSIATVADLASSDLVVVLCATTAPCGKAAASVLEVAGVSVTPKSIENSVKAVVAKVTTGEADAGIVFVTDVLAAGSKATGITIPAAQNVVTDYPMAVMSEATNTSGAKAFIAFAASPAGQAILARYGFAAP